MLKPSLILTSLFLITGCAPESVAPPIVEDAFFCDVVPERAWFTQAEIEAREAGGFTRNLAWQYRVNLAWDRECAK